MTWAQKHGTQHILIEPSGPTQNAYIRSFNSTFRDECLDESWVESLDQARQAIAKWRLDYNEVRPRSSCGRLLPATHQSTESPDKWQNSKTNLGLLESKLVRQLGAGQYRGGPLG